MSETFQKNCLDLAQRALKEGVVDRRTFFTTLAATGLLTASANRIFAQGSGEVVFCSWGGQAGEAYEEAYAKPFMAANPNVKVVQNTSGVQPGRVKAMVESKAISFDIGDSSAPAAHTLGKQGLLEKIDYSVVNKADSVDPAFTQEYGASPFAFSSVIAYDSEKFGDDFPQTWKDFYDFDKYKGIRTLRRDAEVMLDTIQLALGGDPAALYPLDVPACLDFIKEIKDKILFWESGSQSEEMMREGEADLGILWQSRARNAGTDSGGRVKMTWGQGILQTGSFVIPKGAPGAMDAQRLLASMLANAEGQVTALRMIGVAPTNPKAIEIVPEELNEFNPMSPANRQLQVMLDAAWWGENYDTVNQAYIDVISS